MEEALKYHILASTLIRYMIKLGGQESRDMEGGELTR
jgi:hypothetical protein